MTARADYVNVSAPMEVDAHCPARTSEHHSRGFYMPIIGGSIVPVSGSQPTKVTGTPGKPPLRVRSSEG